ncbi:hypothetical protein D3C78_1780170 [compost metagenome]
MEVFTTGSLHLQDSVVVSQQLIEKCSTSRFICEIGCSVACDPTVEVVVVGYYRTACAQSLN